MALVAAASVAIAATFVTLAILGLSFMMSVFAGGLLLIVIVVYLVGAARITKAIGHGHETGLRVAKLTRRVAGAMVVNTLVQGCFAVIGSGNSLLPLQFVVVNLLMPVGLSAVMLLLLHFIRGAFGRQGQRRRKSVMMRARTGTTKTTATVSPATDFTKTESSPMTSPEMSSTRTEAWTKARATGSTNGV